MRLILEGEEKLRVEVAGAGLEIESADPTVHFSPLHMLAASLATCTVAVLESWAQYANLDPEGLEVGLEWEYAEDPYRVGRYDLVIRWPGLPEGRRAAALRVAQRCTVEQTLLHPPTIEARVEA